MGFCWCVQGLSGDPKNPRSEVHSIYGSLTKHDPRVNSGVAFPAKLPMSNFGVAFCWGFLFLVVNSWVKKGMKW